MTKFKTSIFVFRRDLRLQDNTALISALKLSEKVIPLFIFDKKQRNHDYFSNNAFEFMINSLKELQNELRTKGADLLMKEGNKVLILKDLKELTSFDALFVNEDYTPFSKKRDEELKEFCKQNNISFHSFHDYLINEPSTVLNKSGEPFKVFSAFHREAIKKEVKKPFNNNFTNYFCPKIKSVNLNDFFKETVSESNKDLMVKGGRKEALTLLNELKNKNDYETHRNYVYEDATSKLSAHLKFGTISIRETYWFLNNNFFFGHPLTTQLYWRDFFTHIAYFYPEVFGRAFKEKYDKIKWRGTNKEFEAWKNGKTGFPLVDAGMRQLNKTGWMHGRTRMLVGAFLVKNLGVDWRLGEKYFAQKLVDYDPCVNNGNWQWVASTGCDAQPYFRVFNPLLQQQKFDPDCEYIKEHVEELRGVDAKKIRSIISTPIKEYPEPIVDYSESVKKAKKSFKEALHH